MSTKTHKKAKRGSTKGFAQKRTMNPSDGRTDVPPQNTTTDRFQQHDTQRRLGGFEQKGEHARTSNRGHQ